MQQSAPTVDIVIAAKNEAGYLPRCLEALASQTYPRDKVNVIVVDNGSTDSTPTIAQNRGVTLLSWVDDSRSARNVSAVRNVGVKEGRGELVGFLDAHCIVHEGWLESMVKPLLEPDVGGVVGRLIYECEDPVTARFVRQSLFASDQRLQEATISGRSSAYPWIPAGNAMFKREALLVCGLFDEKLVNCEDAELSWRVVLLGYRLVAAPGARVTHYDRGRWQDHLCKYISYGFGAAQIAHSYGLRGSVKSVEPKDCDKALTGKPWEAFLIESIYQASYAVKSLQIRLGFEQVTDRCQKVCVLAKLRPAFSWHNGERFSISREAIYWFDDHKEEVTVVLPAKRRRYVFYGTANVVFRELGRGRDRQAVLSVIVERFAADSGIVAADVDEFFAELIEDAIVQRLELE